MIPVIYLVIFVAYSLFILAEFIDDDTFRILVGFIMLAASIFIFREGMGIFKNFATLIFASVTFGLGAYLGIKGGMNSLY